MWLKHLHCCMMFGKAVTHRIEGKHHHIGAELARKYGMDERIAHAIEAHHDDIEATTPEAVIVRVCDAMSGARPGARNASAENFAERNEGARERGPLRLTVSIKPTLFRPDVKCESS